MGAATAAAALASRQAMERTIRRRFEVMRGHNGHPHLPEYQEMFETADKFYIVVSYAPGGDLTHLLERHGGRLPEPLARRLVRTLLQTLAYLHRHGIVHRDLKSSNVLLRDPEDVGSAVVVDFAGSFVGPADDGPATAGSGSSSEGSSVGRPGTLMRTVTGTPLVRPHVPVPARRSLTPHVSTSPPKSCAANPTPPSWTSGRSAASPTSCSLAATRSRTRAGTRRCLRGSTTRSSGFPTQPEGKGGCRRRPGG
ncbi:kinase-like domain-containing protein [Hyaloraphidium curvatum]|nr:kinase-like domain-containing protein [Hyaloraphidium curvatum]